MCVPTSCIEIMIRLQGAGSVATSRYLRYKFLLSPNFSISLRLCVQIYREKMFPKIRQATK